MAKQKTKHDDEAQGHELALVAPPSALALISNGGVGVRNELAAAFIDEAKGQIISREPDLPILRIDHRKGRFTLGGEPFGDSFDAYLLHYYQQRAWWEGEYQPGNSSPPDCASLWMVKPDAGAKPQARTCMECPHSKFDSGKNGSQACRVSTWCLMLSPENFPPMGVAAVSFSPSSIKSMLGSPRAGGGFVGRAKQFRRPGEKPSGVYAIVWSRFTLREVPNQPFFVMEGEPLNLPASIDEVRAIGKIRGSVLDAFERMRGTFEEEPTGDVDDPGPPATVVEERAPETDGAPF